MVTIGTVREGLAREFPEVGRAVERLRPWLRERRVSIAREPLPLAVLSAVGADALASALTTLALWAASRVLPFAFGGVAGFGGFVAMVAASAVALRAGGLLALIAYVGIVALRLAATLPGLRQFCDLAIGAAFQPACTPEGWLVARWEEALAIGLGVVAARGVTASVDHENVAFRVAGIVAVANAVAWTIPVATAMSRSSPALGAEDSLSLIAVFAATSFAGAVIAGAVLGRMQDAAGVAAFGVALVILTPWLISLQLAIEHPPPPGLLTAPATVGYYLGLATPPVAVVLFTVALLSSRLGARAR